MLVFGESMLNDAVAIVLTSTALEISHQNATSSPSGSILLPAVSRFTFVFLVSALLGAFVGFLSALVHIFVLSLVCWLLNMGIDVEVLDFWLLSYCSEGK